MKDSKKTMRKARRSGRWAAFIALLMTVAGCGWYSVIPPPGTVEGWGYARPPETYDPETLFHYMNGKARVYLDYGFVKLNHAEFAPTEAKPVVDVDVYDMGSSEGAFGIYSLERGDDLPLHYKTRLGYMVASSRFFWKGRYYVAITSADTSPETIDAIKALSLYVEKSLRAGPEGIPLLAAFPADDRVTESEQYFAMNFLGYEFMGAGFTAAYHEKGGRFKLFLSPKDSPQAARAAYEKLRAALSGQGELTREESGIGQSAFAARDDYLGNWLVAVVGKYVVGATGFQDAATARRLVAGLCRSLSTPAFSAVGESPGGGAHS